MNKIINTKKSGMARAIIFKSGKVFKAVCLDFDLIEEAKTMTDAENLIKEAVVGYIKNVCKNNLSDELLNRPAKKKYWDIYHKYLEYITKREGTKKLEGDCSVDLTSMFTIPINSKAYCCR
jgi:hypothetical protein